MKEKFPRVAVFISGRGTNMTALLKAEKNGKLPGKIVLIVSNNPDAKGLKIAEEYGKETVIVDHRKFNSRRDHEVEIYNRYLSPKQITHVILAGYMRVITNYLIEKFRYRMINIHPSLLPCFKGLHAQKQALDYGVKITGCTVHFVSENVDGGPIIVQKAVPVYDTDNEETLSQRILEKEHEAIVEAAQIMLSNNFEVINDRIVRITSHSNS